MRTPNSRTVTDFMGLRSARARNPRPDPVLSPLAARRERAHGPRPDFERKCGRPSTSSTCSSRGAMSTEMSWASASVRVFPAHQDRLPSFPGPDRSHLFPRTRAGNSSSSAPWIERGGQDHPHPRSSSTTSCCPSAVEDVGGAVDTAQWQAVLRSASALEAYRRFYVREILPWKVAEFVIFSDSFPRSLHYCVVQIDDFLRRILGETWGRAPTARPRAPRGGCSPTSNPSRSPTCSRTAGLHEFLPGVQKSLWTASATKWFRPPMFYPTEAGPDEICGNSNNSSMLLRLIHRTTFVYAGQARDSFNEVRLHPVNDTLQTCPAISNCAWSRTSRPALTTDFYGNLVEYFDITTTHSRLVVEAESEVETVARQPGRPSRSPPFESPWRPSRPRPAGRVHRQLALRAARRRGIRAGVPQALRCPRAGGDVQRACGGWVITSTAPSPTVRTSPGCTRGPATRLRLRAGVCQDFAHVMIGLCRCAGIPARYVSGYFLNLDRQPGARTRPRTPGWKRTSPATVGPPTIRPTTASRTRTTSSWPVAAGLRRHPPRQRNPPPQLPPRANCGWPSGSARRPGAPSRPRRGSGRSRSTATPGRSGIRPGNSHARRVIIHVVGVGAHPFRPHQR